MRKPQDFGAGARWGAPGGPSLGHPRPVPASYTVVGLVNTFGCEGLKRAPPGRLRGAGLCDFGALRAQKSGTGVAPGPNLRKRHFCHFLFVFSLLKTGKSGKCQFSGYSEVSGLYNRGKLSRITKNDDFYTKRAKLGPGAQTPPDPTRYGSQYGI